MFLKNYTSEVPVSTTIARIEAVLIHCGASAIAKEYSPNGAVSAMRFEIPDASGTLTIRLPAYEDRALDTLWKNYVGKDVSTPDGRVLNGNKKKRRSDFVQQASRTAWRLVQDWTEVQMSMIQMKQAQTLEVFLPYVIVSNGKTFYQLAQERGMKNLLPAHQEGVK